MRLIWSVAVTLVLTSSTFAQPFFFSEPTPLTTTRYVAYGAQTRLVSNGVLPYLFWTTNGRVWVTPGTPLRRVGRPVLPAESADAVWTGTHFVVVAFHSGSYVGRLVGADGETIGDPFTILENGGPPAQPQLAFDGRRVLLLYGTNPVKALLLTREGVPLGEPRDAPVDGTDVSDVDVTARSEEFLAGMARRQYVVSASVRNTAWTSTVLAAPDNGSRLIANAAGPADSLTIWTNGGEPMTARFAPAVPRPGDLTEFTLHGTALAAAIDVTYDGKDYIYAYRIGTRIHFRYFNAPLPFASVDAAPFSPVRLTSANGRTYAAWHAAGGGNPIILRDVLTLTGDAGAFGAAAQALTSTASSATSALFVWAEWGGTLHAGVRTANGEWFERQIVNQGVAATLAASDGSGFVIVHVTPAGWTSTLLDGQANILGNGPTVPFAPTGITWTGDAYVVVGLNASRQVVASKLSPAGTVTAPAVIALPRTGYNIQDVRVTSRGNELLVVWDEHLPRSIESDLLGVRLTPTLQRVDTQALRLAPGPVYSPDVVWDGTRYLITWSDGRTVLYRTLRTNSAISGITKVAGLEETYTARAVLVPGGVALTCNTGQVVFLRETETVQQLGRHDNDALVTIGNRLAYVQTLIRDEMPYHGASRLNVRIGDLVAPGPKPSAPQITRAVLPTGGAAMIIEWTAPPEPVNGYRVEYRVNNSVWNELDEWFDARSNRLVIRPWRTDPAIYEFRVRAVNDAGFGPYSAVAGVRTRKIRAVR